MLCTYVALGRCDMRDQRPGCLAVDLRTTHYRLFPLWHVWGRVLFDLAFQYALRWLMSSPDDGQCPEREKQLVFPIREGIAKDILLQWGQIAVTTVG